TRRLASGNADAIGVAIAGLRRRRVQRIHRLRKARRAAIDLVITRRVDVLHDLPGLPLAFLALAHLVAAIDHPRAGGDRVHPAVDHGPGVARLPGFLDGIPRPLGGNAGLFDFEPGAAHGIAEFSAPVLQRLGCVHARLGGLPPHAVLGRAAGLFIEIAENFVNVLAHLFNGTRELLYFFYFERGPELIGQLGAAPVIPVVMLLDRSRIGLAEVDVLAVLAQLGEVLVRILFRALDLFLRCLLGIGLAASGGAIDVVERPTN